MYYPTTKDVSFILKRIETHGTGIAIIKKGQLEFALEKPAMRIFGVEQYPELYQKAAVLMETITKIHPFSDGNKRAAMMIAEYTVMMNGGRLVVPLKAVRLSVDAAMDVEDAMGEEIQMWFKTHTATNSTMLGIMLYEKLEEELIIPSLLKQQRYGEAEALVDKWMAFDTYPEHRQMWSDLMDAWKRKEGSRKPRADPAGRTENVFRFWRSMAGITDAKDHLIPVRIDLNYLRRGVHGLEDLKRLDNTIKSRVRHLEGGKGADDLWSNAAIFERFGLHGEALDCLDRIHELGHDKDRALAHRMAHLIHFGLYDECVRVGEELLLRAPSDAFVLLECSRAYRLLGKNERALELLDRIDEKDPYYINALTWRGYVLLSSGSHTAAAGCFERAYDMRPDDTHNIKNKAIAMSIRGRHAESIELYDIALKGDPNDATVWCCKGLSLYQEGDTDGAVSCYKKALEIDPRNTLALVQAGACLSVQGRRDEGIAYLARALEVNPADKAAMLNMGIALLGVERYKEALKNLNAVIKTDPGNVLCLHVIAAVHALQGNVPGAMDMIEKIARLDPRELERVRRNDAFGRLRSSGRFQDLLRSGSAPRGRAGEPGERDAQRPRR